MYIHSFLPWSQWRFKVNTVLCGSQIIKRVRFFDLNSMSESVMTFTCIRLHRYIKEVKATFSRAVASYFGYAVTWFRVLNITTHSKWYHCILRIVTDILHMKDALREHLIIFKY